MQVIVDDRLKGIDHLFCGSGLNTRTVEIDMDDLIRLVRAVTAPIVKATAPGD